MFNLTFLPDIFKSTRLIYFLFNEHYWWYLCIPLSNLTYVYAYVSILTILSNHQLISLFEENHFISLEEYKNMVANTYNVSISHVSHYIHVGLRNPW